MAQPHEKAHKLTLPAVNTNPGIEARVLIAETRGPAQAGYSFDDATTAMEWMHLIIHNRMEISKGFVSHGSHRMLAVVKAHNQFAGFEHYPNVSHDVHKNIEDKLHFANMKQFKDAAVYQAYISKALEIANGKTVIHDPSPGRLTYWRQAKSDDPGGDSVFFRTFQGNDYYYSPK